MTAGFSGNAGYLRVVSVNGPGRSGDQREAIPSFTAHLHQHAEQFVPPPTFVRPSWDWQRLFGTSSVLGDEEALSPLAPHQHEDLTQVATQMQHASSVLGNHAPQRGLIHAELHRGSMLLHHGTVGVIDFDDYGWGSYIFDLASVLDSFFRWVVKDPTDWVFRKFRAKLCSMQDELSHKKASEATDPLSCVPDAAH